MKPALYSLIVLSSLVGHAQAAEVQVSLPQVSASPGDVALVALTTADLSGQGVLAYLFTVQYDANVLEITGVSTEGTLSAGMTVEANTETPGLLSVAALKTSALSGAGTLLNLEVRYLGRGVTTLDLSSFLFNEGEPQAKPVDGRATVQFGSPSGIDLTLPTAEGRAGRRVVLPVQVGSLSGREVVSYLLEIIYDPAVLELTGVTTEGTLSADMSAESHSPRPGWLSVAASQPTALTGSGILVNLAVRYKQAGTSTLYWANALFNEGTPQVDPHDGAATVTGTAGGLEGDFDFDGDVDFNDFFLFADQFGRTTSSALWDELYDLDPSGQVNFEDFFIFADQFGKKE